VVLINNRAGFLATVAATSWTALHLYRRFSPRLARSVRRRLMAGTAALGVVLFGVVLIGTPAGQRLTETFDPDASTPSSATAGARLHVYQLVIDYVAESPGRVIGGVGMGPDFLTESGATPAYDPGETLGVRSPHNFALGTLARLGVVGAALHVAVVAIGYVLAGRLLSRPHVDELTALAALIVVAVPVAGLVGVVLESPFGAIPYYWGYGMLLAEMTRQRLDGDFSQTKSQQSHTVAARG
ncbi:MAG: O-antigen ligase family protein, partial [Actinomycetes bacterium]